MEEKRRKIDNILNKINNKMSPLVLNYNSDRYALIYNHPNNYSIDFIGNNLIFETKEKLIEYLYHFLFENNLDYLFGYIDAGLFDSDIFIIDIVMEQVIFLDPEKDSIFIDKLNDTFYILKSKYNNY